MLKFVNAGLAALTLLFVGAQGAHAQMMGLLSSPSEYVIKSKWKGTYIAAREPVSEPRQAGLGGPFYMADTNNIEEARWQFESVDGGRYVKLRSLATGRYLVPATVMPKRRTARTPYLLGLVRRQDLTDDSKMYWKRIDLEDGHFRLHPYDNLNVALHIEKGTLQVGAFQPGWYSALWRVEKPATSRAEAAALLAKGRSVRFENNGGYVAKLSVHYMVNKNIGGQKTLLPEIQYTNDLSSGFSETLQLPDNLSADHEVRVFITGAGTTPNPIHSATLDGKFSGEKCYQAQGYFATAVVIGCN